ncbi:GTPase [Winogradskyella luteola]|uniref:GTPase n=1 Tax=Winogradskyella luteola TaxID=2828330 RepID=A0A9X1F8S5_9FLAO|nr:GTPase [Winogradskyella luteola]MBV7269442.1 GTPase [Winogradskyella luteola]
MKLLFIYNANSGKLNALFDVGHKLFSPSTYPCSLCALTYDTFSENKIWKAFRQESHFDMEFYHKDVFEITFPNVKVLYPIVLKLEQHQLTTVINPDVLNEITNVEELIEKLSITL